MANYFETMLNNAGDWMASKIAPYLNDAMGVRGSILANYYQGDHRPQLKTKVGAQSDNITQNFVGLAVDRSVSRLFRGGVKFNLPDGSEAQQEYLERVWDLNKKEIILYQVGLHGAVYGTAYFKVCPDEMIDPYSDQLFPRLVAIDPEIIRIVTDSQDMNEVEQYVIEYKTVNKDGKEIGHREITRQAKQSENETDAPEVADTWVIEEWEQSTIYRNQWTKVLTTSWDYSFPPIIHWKNLPSLKSCYGDSDIDDAINVQDKSNFVVSNTGKIIKFHAHPETIGTGFAVKDMQALEAAVGSFHAIPNENAKVYNLEMSSDLASSRAFALDLRQSIFDIAREVDISSMADKLGALTNFGLQVLWSDAVDKNYTKRRLYGDAILELNRRLLVLNNWTGEASQPGKIKWGEALPINIMEEMLADEKALGMGIVDKETVSARYHDRYGKSWEDILAALEEEKTGAASSSDNIGAMVLRNFNQGGGNVTPMVKPQPQNGMMNNANSSPTSPRPA
jgi:hypothetical protein